ncbi:IucA/IucC family protein [Pseudonocardia nigra]|uniref:IucA/IucC family protein n=1 Tax=Pseudonocardia nigra TaxID=1921578 RepID=UPI001C5F1380|nr:IucA/IucC family protein [Pseudonocardia nigra]
MTAGTLPAPTTVGAPGTADLVQRALRAPQLEQVRRRLFRQLLESLLYEEVLAARPTGDGTWVVDGRDEDGEPVGYLFGATRRYGFDRVRLGPEPVLRRAGGTTAEADSTTRLLGEVRDGLDADPARLATFARELEETLVKDALAQYVRAQRGDRLAGADHDTLEWAIMDGHPYHPAYKSRIGFDLDDDLAFGPEFAHPVRPLWLAAHRATARVAVSGELDEAAFLREQLGAATIEEFHERIREAGADPADHALLPVHPWQWREHVCRAFARQLRAGELIVLGEDPHAHLAQQSIRTLACRDVPERAYLKLSLSIVNTSTSRGLAPHTVGNAAPISDWLRRVVDDDPYLSRELGLIVLGEVMGVAVDPPPVSELLREDGYGALACIWRESLHVHLEPGEQAVPFTGLTARELDGTPLVDPWVREYGVRRWVEDLVAVSVLPLVHLLQGHGIALEAHAQNMLLVHSGGRPRRLAVKDFHDGIRFSRAHLADPERCPELAGTPAHHTNRNSFLETDDLDLVTDFLLDAFCFVNLGELAILLDDAYGFAEPEFWAAVRDAIEAYQRRHPELADRFAQLDVFKPFLAVEKLTTRRLQPDTELRLHSVPNPLAGSTARSNRGSC